MTSLTLPTAKAGGFSVRRQQPGGAGAYIGSLSVSPLGLPDREDSEPLIVDVDGRVEINIMDRTTPADPIAVRERQGVVDRTASVAHLRRGEETIDHDQVF